MLIEILGTRIVGPVFGVNLFVWSALLSVTLASLATGYYCGGILADRMSTLQLLGSAMAAAGVLLGLVPAYSRTVLRGAEALGPGWGALLSATLLFAPCLVVLGMIGPIAVRLATTNVRSAGRGVGLVDAVSTAGSLTGTLVTGFVLIPAFETDPLIVGTATLLTTMGAVSLAWRRRRLALGAIVLPLLAWAGASKSALPPGIQMLAQSQSLYGLVQVIDDANRNVRFLRADLSVIGAQFRRETTPLDSPSFISSSRSVS